MRNLCPQQDLVIQNVPSVGVSERRVVIIQIFTKVLCCHGYRAGCYPLFIILSAHFHPYQVHEQVGANTELLLGVF